MDKETIAPAWDSATEAILESLGAIIEAHAGTGAGLFNLDIYPNEW